MIRYSCPDDKQWTWHVNNSTNPQVLIHNNSSDKQQIIDPDRNDDNSVDNWSVPTCQI